MDRKSFSQSSKTAGRSVASQDNLKELAERSLGGLLLKYSWPALISMSLNALYAVVDRLYIGWGCGEAAMAGMQLAMPVMMLFTAFGVFIGMGHATLLSIRLGERDRTGCEQILGELVAFKILFSLVVPPLVFFNVDAVLNWCGGARVSTEAFDCARTYLRLVVFSQVFSHIAFGLSAAMRSEGSALRSMLCMVVGFGLNLVLDPIFIFGLKMGIAGAAWATNIAMLASFFYAFSHYWRGASVVRLRLKRCWFYPHVLWRTSSLGFAPFLMHLMSALIMIALTTAFTAWSTDEAQSTRQIASLGVFNSMMILTFMPIMGVQQGLQPLLGFNWGARNFSRVRKALILGFWATTACCVLVCAIQVIPASARFFVSFFVPSDNPGLRDLAVHDLIISNCMIWCIAPNVLATTYFQSIGHPRASIILSLLRQGVILMPCIWLLPRFVSDPMLGIWLALPVSDVLCQLATLVPMWAHYRFLSKVRDRARLTL